MARETILSPSHYRLTAFLFSYYSPVKTRRAGVCMGRRGWWLHITLFFIEKLSIKKAWQSKSTPE